MIEFFWKNNFYKFRLAFPARQMETVAFPSTYFTVLIKRALMFMLQEVLI